MLFNPDFKGEGVLAGPSVAGLGDPGNCALISFTQLTATLLTWDAGNSGPLITAAMLQLGDEAGDAFLAAEKALDDALILEA